MNHTALMLEIVRTFKMHTPPANLAKVIHDHAPDPSGHCRPCHVRGPCTIWSAALNARHAGKPVQ